MGETELSVVIPTYNEEMNIKDTLLDIEHYLDSRNISAEVLIVDDGSKDQTNRIVKELASRYSHIRLISNTINRGKGAVIRQGMLAATGQYVLFMDADNATKIIELDKFLPRIRSGAAIVIGSRRLKDPTVSKKQPWRRKISGGLYIHLAHWVLNIPAADYNCGFKLFRSAVVRPIFEKVSRTDWSFDVEIFLMAKKLGLKIQEVPVNWKHGMNSKVSLFRDGIRSFWALIQIRQDDFSGKYTLPDKPTLRATIRETDKIS